MNLADILIECNGKVQMTSSVFSLEHKVYKNK